MTPFTRKRLADIAEREAKKHLVWKPGSEADKFKKKFWPVFGKGKWSWCAATVTWCCEEAGLPMPIKCPSKFGYTFGLVEGWQQWAIEKGFYYDNDGKFEPERGDITCFDWSQTDINQPDTDFENHIGVFLGFSVAKGAKRYLVAEGNTSNQTNIKERSPVNVQGFVRIPDGYSFTETASDEGSPLPKPKKTLNLGDKGEEVKGLQAALIRFSLKFSPGPIDGVYGLKTKEAITNFQIYNKMTPITGTADEATLDLL